MDGSEEYLVSEILMSLFGEKTKSFRDQLKKKKSPKELKDLLKLITPPKEVRRRDGNQQSTSPVYEDFELFACKNVCRVLNYTKHLLILVSAVTGCVSISAFGIASSAVGLTICEITAGTEMYK